MITRILIVASLLLSCSLCLAEDFPETTNEIKSLTAEQAVDLVAKEKWQQYLSLDGLTSIDKDVAQVLAKIPGGELRLWLPSINKEVAQELANFTGDLSLGLTSIDKEVAKELTIFKGKTLTLDLRSLNKEVAKELAKFKGRMLYLYPKALRTYEEVNGKSDSVRSGGMF